MIAEATLKHFADATAAVEADARRDAIIEHRRTMKDVRRRIAANRERIDAEWNALAEPPRTIAGHLAELSSERRAELEREWNDG